MINQTLRTISLIIYLKHLFPMLMVLSFVTIIPIFYIIIKFDEILKSLRTAILWNNKRRIINEIANHQDNINLTRLISNMSNYVIGFIYLFDPYLFVLTFHIIIDQNMYLTFRLVMLILLIVSWVIIYINNYFSSYITIMNKNVPRQLYRGFCQNRNIDTLTKMKIAEFVFRLDSEFIGFYCLNMFKFTRRSFYEYFLTISITYILIINILNN
jgi:hypothetical protein